MTKNVDTMTPYKLGQQDRRFGRPRTANPYGVTQWAVDDWNRGWDEENDKGGGA